MKTIKQLLILLFTITLFISCGDDDSGEVIIEPDPAIILEEEREETTHILITPESGNTGSKKTWKISEAILSNDFGTIDISDNFNVVDDEFIFTADGNLEWRIGNDINMEGKTSEETLLDYYRSPVNSDYDFDPDSSSDLTALGGEFSFTVLDDGTITGTLSFDGRIQGGGELTFILGEKGPEDFPPIPLNGLNFTEAFSFESDGIASFAPGMIGSFSDNSLFLVTREDGLTDGTTSPERIIKFDIATGAIQENLYFNSDYVSKQLHIINGELIVIGGRYVNTYNLDFSGNPTTTAHGLVLTRMGMAVTGDDAYIVGGDIDGDENEDAEKVYKWNLINQTLDFVTDLPEDRYGARATIVNNKLYVFGGAEVWLSGNYESTIYIYDINTGSISTENMTSAAEYTFVDKFQNLIYVAGQYPLYDANNDFIGFGTTLGVYNTEDNTFTDIPHDLDTTIPNTIHGLCIMNNNLYIIYGNGQNFGGQFGRWSIMVTPIN